MKRASTYARTMIRFVVSLLLVGCTSEPPAVDCALSADENVARIEAGAEIEGDFKATCLLRLVEQGGNWRLAELVAGRATQRLNADPLEWTRRALRGDDLPAPERLRLLQPLVGAQAASAAFARAGMVEDLRRLLPTLPQTYERLSTLEAAVVGRQYAVLDLLLAEEPEAVSHALLYATGHDDLEAFDYLLGFADSARFAANEVGAAPTQGLAMLEHVTSGVTADDLERGLELAARHAHIPVVERLLELGAMIDRPFLSLLEDGCYTPEHCATVDAKRARLEAFVGPELMLSDHLARSNFFDAPRPMRTVAIAMGIELTVPDSADEWGFEGWLSDHARAYVETPYGRAWFGVETGPESCDERVDWRCVELSRGHLAVEIARVPLHLRGAINDALDEYVRRSARWLAGTVTLPATGLVVDLPPGVFQTFAVRGLVRGDPTENSTTIDRVLTPGTTYDVTYIGPHPNIDAPPDCEGTPVAPLWRFDAARHALVREQRGGCFLIMSAAGKRSPPWTRTALERAFGVDPVLMAIVKAIDALRYADISESLLIDSRFAEPADPRLTLTWAMAGDWRGMRDGVLRASPAFPKQLVAVREVASCAPATEVPRGADGWTRIREDATSEVWCIARTSWQGTIFDEYTYTHEAGFDRSWITRARANITRKLRPEDTLPPVAPGHERQRAYERITLALGAGRGTSDLRTRYAELVADIAASKPGTRSQVPPYVLARAARELKQRGLVTWSTEDERLADNFAAELVEQIALDRRPWNKLRSWIERTPSPITDERISAWLVRSAANEAGWQHSAVIEVLAQAAWRRRITSTLPTLEALYARIREPEPVPSDLAAALVLMGSKVAPLPSLDALDPMTITDLFYEGHITRVQADAAKPMVWCPVLLPLAQALLAPTEAHFMALARVSTDKGEHACDPSRSVEWLGPEPFVRHPRLGELVHALHTRPALLRAAVALWIAPLLRGLAATPGNEAFEAFEALVALSAAKGTPLSDDLAAMGWAMQGDALAAHVEGLVVRDEGTWRARFVGLQRLGRLSEADAMIAVGVPADSWPLVARFVRGEPPALD